MEKRNSSAAVITIDGPSGVGKGTLSERLASKLGWHFLDSGVLYRIVGLVASKRGIDFDDAKALASMARALNIEFKLEAGVTSAILVDGVDVKGEIRTEACGQSASKVAAHSAVRDALTDVQRGFQQLPGLVTDGRDMGTVIFPEAELKLYLTASAEVRGERRYKQLQIKGFDGTLADVVRELEARDERDANRKVAPLKPADDAIIIDTSTKSIDEVFAEALSLIEEKGLI